MISVDRYVYKGEGDGGREHRAVAVNPNLRANAKRVLDNINQ